MQLRLPLEQMAGAWAKGTLHCQKEQFCVDIPWQASVIILMKPQIMIQRAFKTSPPNLQHKRAMFVLPLVYYAAEF